MPDSCSDPADSATLLAFALFLLSMCCKISFSSSKTASAIYLAVHDLQPFMTWHVDFINSWLNLRTTSVNLTLNSGWPSKKCWDENLSMRAAFLGEIEPQAFSSSAGLIGLLTELFFSSYRVSTFGFSGFSVLSSFIF